MDYKINELVNLMTKKKLVNKENYPLWAVEMDLLIVSKGLESHIYEENIKIITDKDEGFDKTKCKKIYGTPDSYYSANVTSDQIKSDNTVKRYLFNYLNDTIKEKINFKTNTAYSIWNLLKDTFQADKEERKLHMLKELDEMTFNREEDFSMFLSKMETTFGKLIDLGENISDDRKFNYLYNSLPPDIINATNIISYQDNWNDCCEHLKKSIPRLKFLKELKIKQGKVNAFYGENKNKGIYHNKSYHRNNYNNRNNNNNNRKTNYKSNVTCFKCNKRGHKSFECQLNKNKNYSKNYKNNNNNYKRNFNYHKRKFNNNNNNQANNIETYNEEERYNDIEDNLLSMDFNDQGITESNNVSLEQNFNDIILNNNNNKNNNNNNNININNNNNNNIIHKNFSKNLNNYKNSEINFLNEKLINKIEICDKNFF